MKAEKIIIDLARFKNVYLKKIPFNELSKEERKPYSIYVQGIQDGREITILEAISKVDSEQASGLIAKFVGDSIEENN